MRYLTILTLFALVVTGCAGLGKTQKTQKIQEIQEIQEILNPAPYFELVDLHGETWTADEIKGRVTMLYFWSATCAPCIEKLGDLSMLQSQLPDDALLLLINPGDPEQRIRQVVADYPNLNILLNGRGAFMHYQVRFTPTIIFVNKEGNIVETRVGLLEISEALELISEFR